MKRWLTSTCDRDAAAALAASVGLPMPVAAALIRRGVGTAAEIERYFTPRLSAVGDPDRLPGMAAATGRLARACRDREPVVIFADYDVDGITSAALLRQVLARFGLDVPVFLPSRSAEGYGLTSAALARCIGRHRPRLIVTVDCGTNSAQPVREAAAQGIDVIVTDHHDPVGEAAVPAALVNPKVGNDSEARVLAGVGVTFKLCHALLRNARLGGQPGAGDLDLRNYLDLVALGTIADIVSLTGENRIFAVHGLRRLNAAPTPGIRALADVAALKGSIDAYHVGFMLGPRLNAAGRMGDAGAALELLLATDAAVAASLAAKLDKANSERRQIEARILLEARGTIDAAWDPASQFGLAITGAGWHPGVLGIAATRLSALYCRPVAMAAFDKDGAGRGSARSFGGLDLVAALRECADCLETFGGHSQAAGFTVRRAKWDAFREKFNGTCAAVLKGCDLRETIRIDDWIPLAEVDRGFAEAVEKMRPFGEGNPDPIWGARDVRFVGEPRRVGERHLKMALASSGVQLEAIAFNKADEKLPAQPMDIAFAVIRNTYRGYTAVQLQIKDWTPAGQSSRQ